MNIKDIEEKTRDMALKVISDLEKDGFKLELVDVEYVKEGSTFYLRVFIDKEGGVTIDDCVAVTEPMNEALDRDSFINEAYIFEVSSPGLDRPLKKEKDFERNLGKKIEIKLFAPMDGVKELEGILSGFSPEDIKVDVEGKMLSIERKKIALVRQAIEF